MSARLLSYVSPMLHPRMRDRGTRLGVILGVVMPLVSALVYPTYRHILENPAMNNSMLLEAPFVVCELFILLWAINAGFELRPIAQSLPRDCWVAVALMTIGVWSSTLFVSKAIAMSVMISLTTMLHLLFGLAVAHLIIREDAGTINAFAAGLAAGLVALTLLTMWRFALPPPLSELPGHVIEWGFALPGFINVRYFGQWSGAIVALFAAMILNKRDDDHASWHDAAYFLAALLTIWSGTRQAVLGVTLACLMMVISQGRIPAVRVVIRLAILTLATLAVSEWLLPHPDASFQLFHSLHGARTADELTSGRALLWGLTYAKWLGAPWFGWGSGSTLWEVHTGWTHTQPHNFVLQFLISWGVVGASGALWLLGRATVAAQRRALDDPRVWPLNVALYSLLIMATLDGALHYPRFIMLIMALFAMILRCGQPRDQSEVTRAAPIVSTTFAPPTLG